MIDHSAGTPDHAEDSPLPDDPRFERTKAAIKGRALLPGRLKRSALSALAKVRRPHEDPSDRVVILCYHSIHPSNTFASASPALFDEHIQWLADSCHIIAFDQALDEARRQQRDRPAVAITFDDGYSDNHEYALPVLARRRVPATFFVTTGLIEQDARVIERLRLLQGALEGEVEGLSWRQIVEMDDVGMTFGAHTWSHPNLLLMDRDSSRFELSASKRIIEDKLGRPVSSFAFPFGKPKHHFSPQTIELLDECGYTTGAAILYRRVLPKDCPLAVPRFAVTNDSLDMLKSKVFGSLDLIGSWQERSPAWISRLISRETSVMR